MPDSSGTEYHDHHGFDAWFLETVFFLSRVSWVIATLLSRFSSQVHARTTRTRLHELRCSGHVSTKSLQASSCLTFSTSRKLRGTNTHKLGHYVPWLISYSYLTRLPSFWESIGGLWPTICQLRPSVLGRSLSRPSTARTVFSILLASWKNLRLKPSKYFCSEHSLTPQAVRKNIMCPISDFCHGINEIALLGCHAALIGS